METHLKKIGYKKNQPIACGKCGSCQERLTAFRSNHTSDPLEYESRDLVRKGVSHD